MDSLDQPDYDAEPRPAEDASPNREEVSVPRQKELRWPLVLALRDLGGAAHKNDIQERVTVLLELTEEQTAIEVPSGARSKLRDRLNWAGNELKHHQVLTYPNPGYRELTPLGRRITESQLDDLLRGTVLTGGNASPAGDLAAAVEQFRRDTGYPTDADDEQKRLREEWHEKLRPENIESLSRHDLIKVACNGTWGNSRYVYPKSDAESQPIERLDEAAYRRMLDNIRYLCWNDTDELWTRYNALKNRDSARILPQRIKDATISKLLAICHPARFLPISAHDGTPGRLQMVQRLGLGDPQGANHDEQTVDANDRLREHLEPFFDDDLYGMATFLYWLMEQKPLSIDNGPGGTNGPPPGGEPELSGLANELLVPVGFLEDIVDLLDDKGQVILYGPPGTGKTYLAQELSKVLAPNDSRRALVQFHPSTSYEDFFEGYRPAGVGDGGIRYELTPGPLARMAERAAEDPDEQHVMVIDEINRGNLPRVLGELLFLLEYRDESVRTLYRPDEPFRLPKNLWFIGTMNTADRSIALVDAALRRRFHFVPFFPDSGPMAGLLRRWLARVNQPAWVGRLVDAVNAELKGDLEGSHLLLGPSHFMKDYGTTPGEQEQTLRRIWEYNIEPFIEDQFFGDPDRIQRYRFAQVLARHGPTAGPKSTAGSDAGAALSDPASSSEDDGTAEEADEPAE